MTLGSESLDQTDQLMHPCPSPQHHRSHFQIHCLHAYLLGYHLLGVLNGREICQRGIDKSEKQNLIYFGTRLKHLIPRCLGCYNFEIVYPQR